MKLIIGLSIIALAGSAAAQSSPGVSLRKILEIPAVGTPSNDGTLFAAAGDPSINVWRLPDGRQVHRIPLPRIVKRDTEDEVRFDVTDFSPDDKYLLMTSTHLKFGEKGEAASYLVDLDKETTRQIHFTRRPCFHLLGGIQPWICPSESASFSLDGKRILITVSDYFEIVAPESLERYEKEALVVDSNGKVLEHYKEVFRQDFPAGRPRPAPVAESAPNGAGIPGFGADGHLLGAILDESACEIRDLTAGTRVSFLEDCKMGEDLAFIAPGAISNEHTRCSKDCTAKYWDAKTGKVRRLAYGDDGGATFTASGDRALALLGSGPAKRVELRGAPFEIVLFSTPTGTGWDSFNGWSLTRNGDYVLHQNGRADDHATVVYETGLRGSGPALAAAPAPAPMIDVNTPPQTRAAVDPDAYAVVIGVEKYRQPGIIPAVDFAAGDAQAMYSYLTAAMGFDPNNVVLLTDAQATRTDVEKSLKWLSNRATAKSRVFVYYAGHGSPNAETGQGYLMPYDADPSYLDETAFPIAKLYASLGKLPTQDVTVVLDACFSGQGGRSLIAKGTRPLVNVVQSKAEPNTAVLAATGANQASASFPEAHHGLLTYYLLAGLQGEADAKRDGKITSDELIAYVRPAVERAAKLQNVEQTPSLISPPEAVSRTWIVLAPKK